MTWVYAQARNYSWDISMDKATAHVCKQGTETKWFGGGKGGLKGSGQSASSCGRCVLE